jgi:DNA (cytosine-5)-methyltransferase 1
MILYNDNDAFVAAWLRNLIEAGELPWGAVVERSIAAVSVHELRPTSHFFAGVGGWPLALQMAGWPDDVPVWTGSAPCQPFSVAGRRKGTDDERHLWPAWRELIAAGKPPIVFGEQVASPDGRAWLHDVRADLEALGYEVGAADLCAAGVGAPHIRQRLYWVAIADSKRREGLRLHLRQRAARQTVPEVRRRGEACWMGNTGGARSRRDAGAISRTQAESPAQRFAARRVLDELVSPGAVGGAWSDAVWWHCRDGKARPAQSGAFPLADGVPSRVGRLRAYGNAIVPEVAATFVQAVMEVL